MPSSALTSLVAVTVLLGLVIWGTAQQRRARVAGGLGLLATLVGSFYLYVVFAPASPTNAAVATSLFIGSALLFRLLSTFEQ
jgi:hypothetical protein